MRRRHISQQLKTGFKAHGNRIAGTGILEDDYSESSFPHIGPRYTKPQSHNHKPIKIKTYPVKTYKLTDEELAKYRED